MERSRRSGENAGDHAEDRRQPALARRFHANRPAPEVDRRVEADGDAEHAREGHRVDREQDQGAEPDAEAGRRVQRPEAPEHRAEASALAHLPRVGDQGGNDQQRHRFAQADDGGQDRHGRGRLADADRALDDAGREEGQGDRGVQVCIHCPVCRPNEPE